MEGKRRWCRSARSSDRRTAPQAAAVGGAGRADLRADRLRRHRRGSLRTARDSTSLAQGERRHRPRQDRQSVASRRRTMVLAPPLSWATHRPPQRSGCERILFDINFFGATDAADDRALAEALKRSHRTVLATRTIWARSAGPREDPLSDLSYAAQGLGTISWRYNFRQTSRHPLFRDDQRQDHSLLLGDARRARGPGECLLPARLFARSEVDPSISASDVLEGRFDPSLVRGKTSSLVPRAKKSATSSSFLGRAAFQVPTSM